MTTNASSKAQTVDAAPVGDPATGLIAAVDGRFGILPDRALPAYDSAQAKAYAVEAMTAGGNGMFALLLGPRTPVRAEHIESLRKQPVPGLIRLVDAAMFEWPGDGSRRQALIFERPVGSRVMTPGGRAAGVGAMGAAASALGDALAVDGADDGAMPMPEAELRAVIAILTGVLKRLAERHITHRALRPWNIFYTGRGAGEVVLGECLSGPPALDQPDWLEPIEGALADPSGRGPGKPADDLFALGATVLALALGRNPVSGVNSDALVAERLTKGSYAALAGRHALPQGIADLLRGLLNDTPRDRWTPNDVERWLTGRYPAQRVTPTPKPADRPFRFADGEFEDARPLAHALARQWAEAASTVRSPRFTEWIKRSLPDKERADAVIAALRTKPGGLSSGGGDEDARLVAAVCMALDPAAPIRFKEVALMPDGLGAAVALAEDRGERRQQIIRLITYRLPSQWLALQDPQTAEHSRLARSADNLVPLAAKNALGFGYERLIYELNPHIPCLGALIEHRRVVEAKELLPALEAAAEQPSPGAVGAKSGKARGEDVRERQPIDRHVAGFLAVRFKVDSSWLTALTEPAGSPAAAMGPLVALAKLQHSTGAGAVPNLAQWLARHLAPVLNAVHNRRRRQELELELGHLVGQGMLSAIARLLGDAHAQNEDRRGFKEARRRFRQLAGERLRLEREISQAAATALAQAGPVAVAAASAIALASLVIVSGVG